jgi:phosphoribosyl-AMP cyclohydrolase
MSDPRDATSDVSGWLDAVAFDERGLVPVIAQDAVGQRVLMLAWADRAALEQTRRSGLATYFSRSRARLWRKGEESGNTQRVREIRIDCDGDAILYLVEQQGAAACHTGRAACFYRRLDAHGWSEVDPVVVEPAQLYGGKGR